MTHTHTIRVASPTHRDVVATAGLVVGVPAAHADGVVLLALEVCMRTCEVVTSPNAQTKYNTDLDEVMQRKPLGLGAGFLFI